MRYETSFADNGPVMSSRQQTVVEIAAAVAYGLKSSAAKNNIRQTADFVNGMIFCGLLVEKGSRAAPRFVEAFRERMPRFRSVIESDGFKDAQLIKARMGQHVLGVSEMRPADMLIHMGLSAEGVIGEIADEHSLTESEKMDIVIFSIALAIISTTRDEMLDSAFKMVQQVVDEKVDVWDQLIPSDDEMWGDRGH